MTVELTPDENATVERSLLALSLFVRPGGTAATLPTQRISRTRRASLRRYRTPASGSPWGLRPVSGEVQGGDELCSAVGVEEVVKGLDSFMDGGRGEAELVGDLSIGQALGDGASDPPLPVGRASKCCQR